MKVTAIIPSRFGSKRFPGKPLIKIKGQSMIRRVYQQADKSKLIDQVCVATDNEQIFAEVKSFGGKAVMTSERCLSGTDRVAEAAEIMGLQGNNVIVNIQGDQPLLEPECLNDLVQPFFKIPNLRMSTLAYSINDEKEIADPGNVKVVFDTNGYALYFSRSIIPFDRDNKKNYQYHKHLGLYAYSYSFLQEFAKMPKSSLENLECLEQLRVLENGYKIFVTVTHFDSPSVDNPDDLVKIEKIIEGR